MTMKIRVFTLAGDDSGGTWGEAHASEDGAYDTLITDHLGEKLEDVKPWLEENGYEADDIWPFIDAHKSDCSLDTYQIEQTDLDIDLCAQPFPDTGAQQVQEAIECLQRARDLLKASGNLRTLLRVRSAISSARGAARIQEYRRARMQAAAEAIDGGFTDEEKADMKHNAQMLDGCETEDELNAELRAQTQGR
jgi:hypothetical protein